MFLSKIHLAPDAVHRDDLWRDLTTPYGVHQAVWRLFGDAPDRDRDFLYRLERGVNPPRLWSLSERVPVSPDGLWTIESKEFRPVLQVGDLLRFSLRVNPVVTRLKKRHDVVMDAKTKLGWKDLPAAQRPREAELVHEAASAWLVRRGERHGFTIEQETLRVDGYETHRFAKPNEDRKQAVAITTCDFEGVLRVLEPEALLAAVRQGIGPAKGFGCGLMLLRRA